MNQTQRDKVVSIYELAPPLQSPIALSRNSIQRLIDKHARMREEKFFPREVMFYGGARDHLVTTPILDSSVNAIVTTEVNNL